MILEFGIAVWVKAGVGEKRRTRRKRRCRRGLAVCGRVLNRKRRASDAAWPARHGRPGTPDGGCWLFQPESCRQGARRRTGGRSHGHALRGGGVSVGRNAPPLRPDRGARRHAKSFLGSRRDNDRAESSFKTLWPELEAPDGKHSAGRGRAIGADAPSGVLQPEFVCVRRLTVGHRLYLTRGLPLNRASLMR
jgi:hypothetical protein